VLSAAWYLFPKRPTDSLKFASDLLAHHAIDDLLKKIRQPRSGDLPEPYPISENLMC
jgi:hypothetical protein